MLQVVLCRPNGNVVQDLPLSKLANYLLDGGSYAWIHLACPSEGELQSVFEGDFPIHSLALDDVRQKEGTAKIDNFGDYIVVVFHALEVSGNVLDPEAVEYVAILGRQYLITVRYVPEATFGQEAAELSRAQHVAATENLGPAGLLYRLVDSKAAASRLHMEEFEARLEGLGDVIFSRNLSPASQHQLMDEILTAKSTALRMHRILLPQAQVLAELGHSSYAVIPASSRIFFQDVQDQAQYLVSKADSLRDLATSTMTTHLTLANHRLNEVMKMLTMIATIFIPLTFVTSVYGMNFRNMPELHWIWAYPTVIVFCLLVALTMLLYFRRRRWI